MVIDAHVHLLPPSFRDRRQSLASRDATFGTLFARPSAKMASTEDLITAMDEDGVATAVAVGYGWCDHDLARESNDYLLDAAARFPHRIIPFCSVHPGSPSLTGTGWEGDCALEEIERCAAAGARGIGELHPASQRIALDSDPLLAGVMALARRRHLPVLVHASEPWGHAYAGKGDTTPDKIAAFAHRFPGNTIIAAHWGGGLPFSALMPEIGQAVPNVFFDSAASPLLYDARVFAAAAAAVGAERLLFGSDFPLVRPKRILEQAASTLAPGDLAAVLGGNVQRVLGLKQG